MALFILSVIFAYLIGSICSAIIVCRIFALPDPRQEGSKNPGATNVLRIAGKHYAIIVLVFDILKGTVPVLIAAALDAGPITLSFTALAAVLGHMFPIFFNFKGGKGVATAIGALLGLHFIVGIAVVATWLIVANFTHYSSLASILSMCLAPLYSLMLIGQVETFPPLICITFLILFKHRSNINRLMDGVEPKFKLKSNIIDEVMVSQPVSAHEVFEPIQETQVSKEPAKSTKATKATVTKVTQPKPKTTRKTTTTKPKAKKPAAASKKPKA